MWLGCWARTTGILETYDSWGYGSGDHDSFTAITADWDVDSTMTRSDLVFLDREENRGTALTPERWRERLTALSARERLTALSARVGVWGVITGLGSIALGAVAPVAAIGLAGIGFFAGGLGAIGTSILVARDLRKASLPLKLAAFVGLPFGASLITFVCGAFWRWPLPIGLVSWSVPVGAILGVTLMVLLLTGFLSHAFSAPGSDWED
jgi:hypothetical protein